MMEAAGDRRRIEESSRITHAWTTATLAAAAFVGKMPELEKILPKNPREKAERPRGMSEGELFQVFQTWKGPASQFKFKPPNPPAAAPPSHG